jgi:hypothetical protein
MINAEIVDTEKGKIQIKKLQIWEKLKSPM